MQPTCPQCGVFIDTSSRFCTNCGNVLEASQPHRQSWEAPQGQNQGQVPPWAQANGGVYQQQNYQGNQNAGGSLGFGGQNDALVKKLLLIVGAVILGALALIILLGVLAFLVPGLRCFFLFFILLLIFIPWFIYIQIRNRIRRTIGRFWWFM
jgi:hypothetical protein